MVFTMDKYWLSTNMNVLLIYKSKRIDKHAPPVGTHSDPKGKERVLQVILYD